MCGFNKLIDMVIKGVHHVKTALKNRGIQDSHSSNKFLITSEMLVDQAKATHNGFGFLFPVKNHLTILDPQNQIALNSEIPIAPPSMFHSPIEMPSSMPIVNHVFNDSSSIGGMNHHASISSPSIGIGIGFPNSPF